MSWSLAVSSTFEKIDEELEAAIESPHADTKEQTEQVDAAKEAAKSIIQSGAVVNTGNDVYVTANGHANKAHQVTAGYGNDIVSVSVSQLTKATVDA